MIGNYLLLRLFGVSACLLGNTVAREVILGGEQSSYGQFPYQVSVQVHGHGYLCGGGIISDRFVLTAAHCVLNRDRQFLSPHISIHARTINYHTTDQPTVTVKVEIIFFPAEFHPAANSKIGDIAVLRVESLGLERHTGLQKLIEPQSRRISHIATIAGYGWYVHRIVNQRLGGQTDGQLRHAIAMVLSNRECESTYPRGEIQSNKQFCARTISNANDRPTSTCVGDAGSPLVHDGIVIGILSKTSYLCQEQHFPGVYTRISYYREMIARIMQGTLGSDIITVHPFH